MTEGIQEAGWKEGVKRRRRRRSEKKAEEENSFWCLRWWPHFGRSTLALSGWSQFPIYTKSLLPTDFTLTYLVFFFNLSLTSSTSMMPLFHEVTLSGNATCIRRTCLLMHVSSCNWLKNGWPHMICRCSDCQLLVFTWFFNPYQLFSSAPESVTSSLSENIFRKIKDKGK